MRVEGLVTEGLGLMGVEGLVMEGVGLWGGGADDCSCAPMVFSTSHSGTELQAHFSPHHTWQR